MTSISSPLGKFTGTTAQITAEATNLFNSVDTSDRGYLTKPNFSSVLSEITANQLQGTSEFGVQETTWNIGQESWNVGQSSYAGIGGSATTSAAQTAQLASQAFAQFDTDHSGTVTLQEFVNGVIGASTAPSGATGSTGSPSTATSSTGASSSTTSGATGSTGSASSGTSSSSTGSTSSTTGAGETGSTASNSTVPYQTALSTYQQAQSDSTAMLAKYDTAGKGYINQTDLMTAWIADPSLGNPLQAANTIAQWDTNSDGKVTSDELALGATISSIADQTLAKLDPTGTGSIKVSDLSDATVAGLPYSAATIMGWDGNSDGQISSKELLAGIGQSINAFVARFDTTGKGYFTTADLEAAVNTNPTAFGGVSASDLMAKWDLNGDGKVDATEISALQLTALEGSSSQSNALPGQTTPSAVLQSAQAQASTMLGQYDTSDKGYITQNDIVNAFTNNPSLGDPTQASNIMATFDLDNNGQLSSDELVVGGALQTLVSEISTILDPSGTGSIAVASIASNTNTALPFSATTLASWDANGDGTLSQAELVQGIYKEVQNTIAQYDTAGKGYFNEADVQSALAKTPPSDPSITSASVMAQWDVGNTGQVTPSDMLASLVADTTNQSIANATPANVTVYQQALSSANAMLSTYDTTGKGYIDQNDIAAACITDPALGDPAQAGSIIKAWDATGNGQLTSDQLVSGLIAGQLASNLLSQLDPTNSGTIPVSQLNSEAINAPYLSTPAATMASWDKNGDGELSQQELISGIRQQANNFVSQYDAAGKGYFTAGDLQLAMTANPNPNNPTPASVIEQWDATADGHIGTSDALAGFAAGQNPTSLMTATSALSWNSSDLPSTAQVLAAMGLSSALA